MSTIMIRWKFRKLWWCVLEIPSNQIKLSSKLIYLSFFTCSNLHHTSAYFCKCIFVSLTSMKILHPKLRSSDQCCFLQIYFSQLSVPLLWSWHCWWLGKTQWTVKLHFVFLKLQTHWHNFPHKNPHILFSSMMSHRASFRMIPYFVGFDFQQS